MTAATAAVGDGAPGGAGCTLTALLLGGGTPEEVAARVGTAVLAAGAPDDYGVVVVDLPAPEGPVAGRNRDENPGPTCGSSSSTPVRPR